MKKSLHIWYIFIGFFMICFSMYSQAPGCPNLDAGSDLTTDCNDLCVELSASFLETGITTSYEVTSVTYAPPFPFTGLANPISLGLDDRWSDVIDLPFNFCFFGDTYNQIQVGSNGVLRLDVDPIDVGPTSNAWEFDQDIPNNTIEALGEANIFGVAHDVDPSIIGTNPEIAWELLGTAPCRTFVVSYSNLAHFSGECNQFISTFQMVLYETTNVIEVYVKEKPFCTSWNMGNAIIGIQNNPGTVAYVPPGRNTSDSPWETTDEAWRFTPNGNPNYEITWFDPSGTDIGNTATINVCPNIDTTYTAEIIYTNCDGEQITLTDDVTVAGTDSPSAGEDGILDICPESPPIDLYTQLTGITPDTGGTWSPPLNSGTGIFDPAIDPAGVYTYTVTGTVCPDDSAQVTVSFINQPDAGESAILDICENTSVVDLFTILTGTPDIGGTWSPTLTSGTGIFDPATDMAGVYTYTVNPSDGCEPDTATVTITINLIPDAGESGTLDICENEAAIDLFTILTGTPNTGGTWSPTLTSGTGIFDPLNDTAGVYTYTVNSSNCGSDTATITVTINTLPDAGESATLDICENEAAVDLFTLLTGTPDTGGTWSPALTSGTSIFDPTTDTAGVYTYTVSSSNCGSDTATVTVQSAELPVFLSINTNCQQDETYEILYTIGTDISINASTGIIDIANNRIYDIPQDTDVVITLTSDIAGTCSISETVEAPNCQCPQIFLDTPELICVDINNNPLDGYSFPLLETNLDATLFSFIWSLDGTIITTATSTTLIAEMPGIYSVSYQHITNGCQNEASTTVLFSTEPERLTLSLINGIFSQNNGIIANVIGGNGNYEFSLDGDPFQESGQFNNVSFGEHEVTVIQTDGCGELKETIFVLGFPNFFTPNNDSFNDYWNVIADFEVPEMNLYIFDKYGKLLKQLDPNGTGWDGTYNNTPMPSTDYWFVAEMKDGSGTYRSHFTLIR